MSAAISLASVTRRYRGQPALADVTVDIEEGSVTGLLGRNGAGKTTLMRIVAGQEFASAGTTHVLGANPAHDERARRRIVFIREDQAYPDIRVAQALRVGAWFYPNWSSSLAHELADDFELPLRRKVKKLSRGMRSALGIVIALAARAEVTLFDEPYAGLDPVARQMFYDRLLAEYAARPRTVLLSTHLIDEVAGLLEHVIVLQRGTVVLDAPTDDLRGRATAVSGLAVAVEEFSAGRQTWSWRRAGPQASTIVVGPLEAVDRARAGALRLHLEPLSLQQVVLQAAGRPVVPMEERTSA